MEFGRESNIDEHDKLQRFILMIQAEVADDIRTHVHESKTSLGNEKKMVMQLLQKPITDYIVSMVLDNLLQKELIVEEAITNDG